MKRTSKYPIGTKFTLRREWRNDGLLIWKLVNKDLMLCVSSGNTWTKGETFDYPIKDIRKWIVTLPKEDNFDILYERMTTNA